MLQLKQDRDVEILVHFPIPNKAHGKSEHGEPYGL